MKSGWRLHQAGDTVRCPGCGAGIGEVTPGTVVRIRLRDGACAVPGFVQRCRGTACRRYYELQVLDETEVAA